MTCTFGRYALDIGGFPEALHSISASWKDYVGQTGVSPPDARLTLLTAPTAPDERTDGWYASAGEAEELEVTCVRAGQRLFTLRYGGERGKVTLIADEARPGSVRLGLRYGMLLALRKTCLGLHGVTLLCGNEVVILSAPSGTGKTTLASLLERYEDAIVINGDFALLTPAEDGLWFEPTPFCGTSHRCLNVRTRVHRIVFLGQSPVNVWRTLDAREAALCLLSNAFVPEWDLSAQQTLQEHALRCISLARMDRFDFAPTREAAGIVIHQQLHEEQSSQ